MLINTAVKRCACVRGSPLAGCEPLSRPKFQRKTYKVTALSLNERTKIKTHLDICRRKEKSKEKESLRLMEHKAFSSTGFLSIYHFVLSFNRKVKRFLKHYVLLACVVVCNSCETTLFWRPESTPSSHYNVRSCRYCRVVRFTRSERSHYTNDSFDYVPKIIAVRYMDTTHVP